MSWIHQKLARSNYAIPRGARRLYELQRNFAVPAPRLLVKPLLWVFLAIRSTFWLFKRVLICEPLFKAYCKSYGRRVHTGVYVHWVQGGGDIIIGDDVTVDGKCSFKFATRFDPNPTIEIGGHTTIAHGCSFTAGKRISIGTHCLIASGVWMFDSPGHSIDPERRLRNLPPTTEEVKPIRIGNNVWIGRDCTILPGVTIGDNSVVATGSVVTSDVAPNCIVAGYPARKINLRPLGSAEAVPPATRQAESNGEGRPVPADAQLPVN